MSRSVPWNRLPRTVRSSGTVDTPRGGSMSKLVATIAMSIDGFTAGPGQSVEDPLGKGGMRLHEWAFALQIFREAHGFGEGGEVTPSTAVVEQQLGRMGATIMGRNMFGGRGPWGDEPWQG